MSHEPFILVTDYITYISHGLHLTSIVRRPKICIQSTNHLGQGYATLWSRVYSSWLMHASKTQFAYVYFVCLWAHLLRDEECADTISFLKKPHKTTALFMRWITSTKDQFLVRDSYKYSSHELLRSRRGYEGSVCLNGLWRVHIFELRKRPVFLRSSLRTRAHRHILSNNSFVVWSVTTNTMSAFGQLICHRITNESFVVSFVTTNAMHRTFFFSHRPFTQKASFLEKKSKHPLR